MNTIRWRMKSEYEKRDHETINNVKDWIKSLAIAAAATMFVTTFMFSTAVVKGDSMYPTLEENDRLIIKKYEILLKTEEYQRGDIIVFESPLEHDDRQFIKRVIGVPGDRISISDGNVYINEFKTDESYIEEDLYTHPLTFGDDFTVSANELFVIGDNRLPNKSNDSRSFGSISFDDVEGKIIFRFLPLYKIGADLK